MAPQTPNQAFHRGFCEGLGEAGDAGQGWEGAFTMVINRQRASSHMQQLKGTDPPNKRATPPRPPSPPLALPYPPESFVGLPISSEGTEWRCKCLWRSTHVGISH